MAVTPSSAEKPRRRGRPAKSTLDAAALIRGAALDVFARHGFSGASIAEIALQAAVAKPLIHYHFATKEALWQAAVGEAFDILQAEMAGFSGRVASQPRDEILRAMSLQLVTFAARFPQLVRIVVDETGKPGPRAEWLHTRYLLPGYQLARSVITGMQPTGASSLQIGSEHWVPLILGVMNFPFLEADVIAQAYGVDVYDEAYIERHAELLYRIIIGLVSSR